MVSPAAIAPLRPITLRHNPPIPLTPDPPRPGGHARPRVSRPPRLPPDAEVQRSSGPSNPPIVPAPVLDRFLNIRARQFLLQRALHQFGNLAVRRKAQSDQLIFCQLRNPRPQRLRKKHCEPQALFEADHAILHLESVQALFEGNHQKSSCQQNQQESVEVIAKVALSDMREEMDQSQQQSQKEYGTREIMKRGIKSRVIGKSLRNFFGHVIKLLGE